MKTRTIFSIGVVLFSAIQFASAIGGIDTVPPASAPHEITFVEPKEAKLTYRVKYKTKDGDRQTGHVFNISLFP